MSRPCHLGSFQLKNIMKGKENLTKKGAGFPAPSGLKLRFLVHFVHFLAATLRSRLFGGHRLEGIALDAYIGFVFLRLRRLGRSFATARTTAHVVLLIWC
jgi:hypothetical protein